MTEKKTTIQVPEAYLPLVADIRLLKSDEQNPNKITLKQQEQIWQSLQRYGWTYPIMTNKDGVFADGEQRAQRIAAVINLYHYTLEYAASLTNFQLEFLIQSAIWYHKLTEG